MTLEDILSQQDQYKLTQFSAESIADLLSRTTEKTIRGKKTLVVKCLVRNKEIQLKPEEIVRQLYIAKLHDSYSYPYDRMQAEYPVHFGRDVKRADIVIFDKDRPDTPYLIVDSNFAVE